MRKLIVFSGALLMISLFVGAPAFAQLGSGTLSGIVNDDQGNALPGVTVTAKNVDTGWSRIDVTAENGAYRIPSVPFGTYDVSAELASFATQVKTGIRVDVGRTVSVNFDMRLSSTAEVIEVTGETPLIEKTESHVATVITPEQVENLPINSRQFGSLAALAPGTTLQQHPDPTRPSNLAVSLVGGSGRNLNVTVDGGDNNDDTVGGINQFYSLEGVEEFNFLANRYKAEYGRSAGGVVNVITKSGTNDPHGTFFSLFRDDSLNALTRSEEDAGITDPSPYSREQFGGSIGGPIVKDRAHFFVAIERSQADTQDVLTDETVALAGISDPVVAVPTKDTFFTGKFTSNINPAQYLTVRYGQQKTSTAYGTGPLVAPNARGVLENKLHSILVSHNYVLSENKLNEFVFQYADFDNTISPTSSDPSELFTNNVYVGQNISTPQSTKQKKYQFKDDFSWNWRGNHHFKTGINFVHEPVLEGTFSIGTAAPIFSYLGEDRSSHISEIRQFGGVSGGETPNNQYGIYFQDDWNYNEKLTFNVGIRYDYVSGFDFDQSINPLYSALAQLPFDFPWLRAVKDNPSGKLSNDTNNIQPRIGAAYDLHGDGRTVIRGGWGIYYDFPYTNANLLFVKSLFGNPRYGIIYSVSDANGIRNSDGSFFEVGDPLPPSQGGGVALPDEAVSPDFVVPYTNQASAGFSHQINDDSAIDVDYVYAAVRDQYQRFRMNGDVNGVPILAGTPWETVFTRFWYNGGFSDYNGVSFTYRQRVTHGIQFQGSYTLSKVTGDTRLGANEFSLGSPGVCRDCTNDFTLGPKDDPKMDGPLVTDARHRLVLSGIFDLPYEFRVTGTFRANSGRPFNAFVTTDPNDDGFAYDIVDENFNAFRGDSFSQLDLRVSKIFRIKDVVSVEGIFEVYNVFNSENPAGSKAGFNDRGHVEDKNSADFGTPVVFAGDIGAGQGEQRVAQFGFRVEF
jgi:outer membrane receptor protein involved in Fe transport